MEFEYIPCQQQPDNQWQGGSYRPYQKQAEADIAETLYKARSCRDTHYGNEHIQPHVIQHPLRRFRDASECGMLAA